MYLQICVKTAIEWKPAEGSFQLFFLSLEPAKKIKNNFHGVSGNSEEDLRGLNRLRKAIKAGT
jgi:hypothetical protein